MSPWPRTLVGRIGLALLGAALAVFALDAAVGVWDRQRPERPRRLPVVPAATAPIALDPTAGGAGTARLALAPVRGTIAIARRLGSLAPDIAPVVEILPGGDVVVRRPKPRANGPTEPDRVSYEGCGAGVVLPTGTPDLGALTPRARGALLDLLRQWFHERPVAIDRLVGADLVLAASDVARLLAWLP